MIRLCRVYDDPLPDGSRFLVDRVWPRGIRRDELGAVWLRDAAPSEELRRWFGHDPARWGEFQVRYAAELDARPDAWAPIADAARHGVAVLLYAAKDAGHNNAVVLAAYVEERLGPPTDGPETDGPQTDGPQTDDPRTDGGGLRMVTCSGCGRIEVLRDEAPPATWTATRGGGATTWLCERCTRENLRALEARLEPAWW